MDFDIFGRNVTDKVGNQNLKTCFTVPPQITCASCTTWQKRGNTKITFFHSNAVLHESAAAVGQCCMHNAPVRSVFLEEKIVICDVFDTI